MVSMRYPLMKNDEGLEKLQTIFARWAPVALLLFLFAVFFLNELALEMITAMSIALVDVFLVYLARRHFADIPHERMYLDTGTVVTGFKKYDLRENQDDDYDEVIILLRYQTMDGQTILQVTKEAPILPLKVLKEKDPEHRPLNGAVRRRQVAHMLANSDFEDRVELLVLPGFPQSGIEQRYMRMCFRGDIVMVVTLVAGAMITAWAAIMYWSWAFRAASGRFGYVALLVFALIVTVCASIQWWQWLKSKESYDGDQSLVLLRNPTHGVDVVIVPDEEWIIPKASLNQKLPAD